MAFTSDLPSADYRVTVTVTSGTGFTALLGDCTYFNVTAKATSGFTIQHRSCIGGGLADVASNTTLDWIAIASR